MLTAYCLDGGDLVLTHYRMLENQPHMRARSGPEDEIAFECEGGGNLPACRAQHMHRGRLRFADDATIRTTWTMFDAGEAVEEVTLVLERDPDQGLPPYR